MCVYIHNYMSIHLYTRHTNHMLTRICDIYIIHTYTHRQIVQIYTEVLSALTKPHSSTHVYIDIDGRELEIHGRFITTNDM